MAVDPKNIKEGLRGGTPRDRMLEEEAKIKEGLRGGEPRDRMLEEEAKIKEGLRGGTPRPGAQPTPSVPPPAPVTPTPTPAPVPPSAPPTPPVVGEAVKTGMGIGKILLIGGVVVVGVVVVGGMFLWNRFKAETGIRGIDIRDGGVTIETDQGTLESSDELPINFPKDFPIYPDVDVYFALKIGADKFSVEWIANGPLLEVVEFYREKLPEREFNWKIVNEVRSENGSQFTFAHNEQDRGGVVTINEKSNGSVRVQVIVN